MAIFWQSGNIPGVNEQLSKWANEHARTFIADFKKNEEMLSWSLDLLVLREEKMLKTSPGFIGLRKINKDILFDIYI